MTNVPEVWLDDDAGPLIRPYALTRGRTRTADGRDLDGSTVVVIRRTAALTNDLGATHERVLGECSSPVPLADVAARIDLPLGVVLVLAGDLIDHRHLVVHSDLTVESAATLDTAQKVLDALRKL